MNEHPLPNPEEDSPDGASFLPEPETREDMTPPQDMEPLFPEMPEDLDPEIPFSEEGIPEGTEVLPQPSEEPLFPEITEEPAIPSPENSAPGEAETDPQPSGDPLSLDHEKFTAPQVSDTITRDEDAYGLHGMPAPDELDQSFDLSILDDPDLDLTGLSEPEEVQEAPETGKSPEESYEDAEFRQLMDQPEDPPQEIPAKTRPVRKGRPRRKKGEGLLGIPNILVTVVWVAIVIAIGVTLGRMLWVCAAEVLAFGREDNKVTVTIYETDTIDDITEKLYSANLIRYPELFKLYAKFAVDDGDIHPGIWDLNTRYDYHALVRMMSPSSSRSVVKVTIPEGYTCRQIFELLEANKVCTFADIAAYCADGELDDYWFLEGVTRGSGYCLEGYLFPDTYEFFTNDSPKSVLKKMLDNFGNRVADEEDDLRSRLPGLNEQLSQLMRDGGKSDEYIAGHQFTMRDVLIVASLIEKETSGKEESPTIASVIYNRLYNWGDNPAYLNIDASIIYALDGKTDLTAEDMRVDSPYNTYYHVGLTPGPIANPGLESIRAALAPSTTDYYYYVLDPAAGSHHFSTTLEEHEAFRASLRDNG